MGAALLAVGLGVLAAACSGLGPHGHDGEFTRRGATEIFSAGFEGVDAFYIQDPDIPALALTGMSGLSRIDTEIETRRRGDQVEVTLAGRPIAAFTAPRDRDVARWSELTSAVVATARLASTKIAESKPEVIYEAVFDSAFTRLDRFSRYAGNAEARRNRMLRDGYSGVGVSLGRPQGAIEITDVIADGPADLAGLAVGDILRQVDGVPVDGMPAETVAERLRGASGTTVTLAVERRSVRLAIVVSRAKVIEQTVYEKWVDGVLYLKITGFNDGTPDAVRAAIDRPRPDRGHGMVFDLRGNRGGVLEDAIALADLFIDHGEILETRGRHRRARKIYMAEEADIAIGVPMLVLIDGASASAAEIFAAAMQDRGRALLIGARSYGKGSIQRIVTLPNRGEIYVTWSKMLAPSGYPLSSNGVLPTVCTASLDGDVTRMGERIRTGELLHSSFADVRHLVHSLDPDVRDRLRDHCRDRAPTPDGRDLDLDLAIELLRRPDLYRRGIETSTLAMRERQSR